MFGWRRRSEGFEWREYVRTTVLVRRADRQRRIEDARVAALNKVKGARDKGVAAGQASLRSISEVARDITLAVLTAVWNAVRASAITIWQILHAIAREISARLPELPKPQISMPRFTLPTIRLPRIPLPRLDMARHRAEAHVPPHGGRRDETHEAEERLRPDVPLRLPFNSKLVGSLALLGLLVFVGGPMLRGDANWGEANFSKPRIMPAPATQGQSVASPAPEHERGVAEFSGRARAIKGDLLRIEGQLVQLADIESPAADHPCTRRNGRRWNCSAAARVALNRLIRGETVSCTTTGEADNGHLIGRCAVGERDLAEVLVSGGHVFAAQGMFASYSASETAAQSKKIGIWHGETLRPDEWRSRVWEDAKQSSPEGCPIKGFMRSSTYAMPWSQGYDRKSVREGRGDRWFCSEEEARSAGFKLAGSL